MEIPDETDRRRQAQRALRLARGITDDRAAQALKASASPIEASQAKPNRSALSAKLNALPRLAREEAPLNAQVPAEKMREMRENARTQLLGETFPGVDPSMGDHVGAELADRVEYLLGEIEILVADAYQQLDQQRKA